MIRKKNFVLLEMIIGFALVSISIVPFLRYPFRHMRQELDMLYEMQLTRFAQERLCAIEREVFQQGIEESLLFHPPIKEKRLWRQQSVTITLPSGCRRTYVERVKLCPSARKKSKDRIFALVNIYLSYADRGTAKVDFHSKCIAEKK